MALTKFNHAANDSPRSGNSRQMSPLVWSLIVVAVVALATYFAMRV